MAVQGSPLNDVNIIGAPLQTVAGVPVGALRDVHIVAAIERVGGVNYTSRFPTPPAAFGFLIDPTTELAFDRLQPVSGGTLIGVLLPEGDYLEPTLGQIWPRIG